MIRLLVIFLSILAFALSASAAAADENTNVRVLGYERDLQPRSHGSTLPRPHSVRARRDVKFGKRCMYVGAGFRMMDCNAPKLASSTFKLAKGVKEQNVAAAKPVEGAAAVAAAALAPAEGQSGTLVLKEARASSISVAMAQVTGTQGVKKQDVPAAKLESQSQAGTGETGTLTLKAARASSVSAAMAQVTGALGVKEQNVPAAKLESQTQAGTEATGTLTLREARASSISVAMAQVTGT